MTPSQSNSSFMESETSWVLKKKKKKEKQNQTKQALMITHTEFHLNFILLPVSCIVNDL